MELKRKVAAALAGLAFLTVNATTAIADTLKITKRVEQILANLDTAPIIIVMDGSSYVEYTKGMIVFEKNGFVTISQREGKGNQDSSVILHVPQESSYDKVSLYSNKGPITITGLNANELQVIADSSDIELSNINSESVFVATDGSINVDISLQDDRYYVDASSKQGAITPHNYKPNENAEYIMSLSAGGSVDIKTK